MKKTARLYYADCYLREFEASVLECVREGDHVRVYLDKTAFYPDSGGQPSDFGTIGGQPVIDVVDEGDAIAHVLSGEPESRQVNGKIDWTRRFDHMQQHTGQHILSAAFEKSGGYKTVSFHLGAGNSTIDLDSNRLGQRQIREAEDLANQILFDDREVRIFFKPAGEANAMGLRKDSAREGELRLVEVADFDLSACGGTHVRRTSAVGLISEGVPPALPGRQEEFDNSGKADFSACRKQGRGRSTPPHPARAARRPLPEGEGRSLGWDTNPLSPGRGRDLGRDTNPLPLGGCPGLSGRVRGIGRASMTTASGHDEEAPLRGQLS